MHTAGGAREGEEEFTHLQVTLPPPDIPPSPPAATSSSWPPAWWSWAQPTVGVGCVPRRPAQGALYTGGL